MKTIFLILVVLLCKFTFANVDSHAAKSDCVNIVGPGWLPAVEVENEDIITRNDYDTVVEEDQSDLVTYLAFVGGSQPIPNACGLNPKNNRSIWTGWGGPIDTDNATIGNGVGFRSEIVVGGVYFERGIATHAPATLVYDLTGGDYQYFEGYIGISDQTDGFCENGGFVAFIFLIDDELVYRSPSIAGNQDTPDWQNISPIKVIFNIPEDAQELKIIFDTLGDDGCDHAVIGDAKLSSTNSTDIVNTTTNNTTTPIPIYTDAELQVKIIYFVPYNRPYQSHIPIEMDSRIKEVQRFYAQQMEKNGYGNKTFQIETDDNGRAIVYNVTGKFQDSYYHSETLPKVRGELQSQFNLKEAAYLVVTDVSTGSIDGSCGIANLDGGPALVPATGECISGANGIAIIAHELGHAFNLKHDFRDNLFIMSYGSNPIKFSACATAALNVNPFFNQDKNLDGISNTNGVIQMLSDAVYPESGNDWKPKFHITDPDGIHQIQFLIPRYVVEPISRIADDSLLICENFDGTSTSATVEYDVPQLFYMFDANQIGIRVFDTNGFVSELYWVLLSTRVIQSVDPIEDGSPLTLTHDDLDSLVPTNNSNEWAGWKGLTWEKTPDGDYPAQPQEYVFTAYLDIWEYWFYSHAESRLVYDISGSDYAKFVAYFHMPASCDGLAAVEVICFADNAEIYRSGVLTSDQAQNKKISFDIPENTNTFTINVSDVGDDSCDHFIIGNATLVYSESSEVEDEEDNIADVNDDGVVNVIDLVIVAINFGAELFNPKTDLNGDGKVDGDDIRIVLAALEGRAAPAIYAYQTELLPNYPNPFNPETWIPYQLTSDSDVQITIYAANGQIVRTLDMGRQSAGRYIHRDRAAYWDGLNMYGERVVSGVYFYQLKTEDALLTRKMLVLK